MSKRHPATQTTLPEVLHQPAQDMIKVEKNPNYISFFSPSKSKKKQNGIAGTVSVRTITYPAREIDGTTVVPKTTIKPDPQLGLPTTGDRDKYMAFMKIVTDLKARVGRIENPIGFTTYELLKHLGLTDAGFHYEEVNQFLERMVNDDQERIRRLLSRCKKVRKRHFSRIQSRGLDRPRTRRRLRSPDELCVSLRLAA